MKRHPVTSFLAIALLSFACSPSSEPAPAETSEASEAEAPPADAAELVARARDSVRDSVRAFAVVETTGDQEIRRGRLVTYPATDKPVFDLYWETADGIDRVRSDGETVVAEMPSGEVLYSPWSEAGSVLYGQRSGKLAPAALDASNFGSYGSLNETAPDADVYTVLAPIPGGGEWRFSVAADTYLPTSVAFVPGPDQPVERATFQPIPDFNFTQVEDLGVDPETAEAATRFYAGPAPGDPAPDVSFELADGTTTAIADLRGRVVVVDFWATWCAPCRPAMKKLEELYQEHADEGLEVYGLRLYDSGDPAEYLGSLGVTYPTGDGAPFEKAYAVDTYGLPTLYVIDREGEIVNLVVGFSEAGEEALVEAVENALAG